MQSLIEQQIPRVVALRRELHQIPELGFRETLTSHRIRRELDEIGIPWQAIDTATIAMIGDLSKPCIALRADIDALPIVEESGLPHASKHAGVMHACGHDGHTACLLGTAAVLKRMELPCCVKLLFQPAEEGGGGAEKLVKAGVLKGVSKVYGLHNWPSLPLGTITTKPGPMMAGMNTFWATVKGKGGHAAYPHMAKDPIIAGAHIIQTLQTLVSRRTDPLESVVVSVTTFHAGTTDNVIPDTAKFGGTVRTLDEASRQRTKEMLAEMIVNQAKTLGCDAEVDFLEGYPPVVNDANEAEFIKKLAGDSFVEMKYPSMGAEDFAYYLREVPGCFFLLGIKPFGCPDYPALHTSKYDFNDEALAAGIGMFVKVATTAR